MNSEQWNIDFSISIYGILAIVVYTISVFSVPNSIRKNLLSIATDLVSDGVLCFDVDRNIIYANKQAKKIIDEGNICWIEDYHNSNKDHITKIEKIDIENKTHIFNVEYRTILDSKGRYSGSFIKLDDKTQEVYNQEIQEYKATHDELTGLYNRTKFFAEAERLLHENPDIPRYFICTNIKDFKVVNDLFGEEFGNALLIRQAEMLSRAAYEGCIHGRISGDKFAMLIPKDKFKADKAIENTEEIKKFSKNINYTIKMYLGLYEIADPYENVHTMYDKANLAIKNVKDDYNSIIVVYDTPLMSKLMSEQKIISDFTVALEKGEFCMFLQPQIESITGKCVGAEALVRWYDSNGVYRHPDEFISILEKNGLIYKLDSYIWELAAKKLNEWKNNGYPDLYISVNISTRDFYYADLYKVFTGFVEQYGISPKNLNLEITESVVIEEKNTIKNVLYKLQQYGFKIEMDDFGSGYSSLNVLKDIPMDVLKIDMEFLRHTQNEKRSNLIIASVVTMARKLGMKVITEGVEDEIQAELLSFMGVDLFQGYLYSKPLAVYDFEHKYLKERI